MFNFESDRQLDTVAIDNALNSLSPLDQEVLCLRYGYKFPPGYSGTVPAALTDIANHIGKRTLSTPPSIRTVQRRINSVLAKAGKVNPEPLSADETLFNALSTNYLPFIKKLAAKLSRGDVDFANDLEQEAVISLWQWTKEDRQREVLGLQAYLTSRIRFSMFNLLREERRQRDISENYTNSVCQSR